MPDLILTNGDSGAELLGQAGLEGRIVPWRDILHEGPLVPAESLSAFSDVRARFLSQEYGLPYEEVRADFVVRDALLESHALFDRVAIWIEHDLYDQLQLLQILDFLHHAGRVEGVSIVQADDFIGAQSPQTVLRFGAHPIPLTAALAAEASATWQTLLAPTPETVVRNLASVPKALPFLQPTLLRFLEELPAPGTGLSRSERTLLAVVAEGGNTPQRAFARLLASEEAAFMGDWSAFRILDDFALNQPLVIAGTGWPFPGRGSEEERGEYLDAELSITPLGLDILEGYVDALAARGIDRWWGGTHMTGHDSWRWDSGATTLHPPAA